MKKISELRDKNDIEGHPGYQFHTFQSNKHEVIVDYPLKTWRRVTFCGFQNLQYEKKTARITTSVGEIFRSSSMSMNWISLVNVSLSIKMKVWNEFNSFVINL